MRSRDREDIGWGQAAGGPGRGSPLVVTVALIVGAISSAAAVLALVGEPQGNSTVGALQAPIAATDSQEPLAQPGPAPQNRQSDDAARKRVASAVAEPVQEPPAPPTASPSSAKTSAAKLSPASMSPAQTDIETSAAAPAKPENGLETVSALGQPKSQADVTTITGADEAPRPVDGKLNSSARFSAHRHSRSRSRYSRWTSSGYGWR